MPKKSKKRTRKHHHVIVKHMEPHVVASVADVPMRTVVQESHVLAAVSKSTWQKFLDWFKGQ